MYRRSGHTRRTVFAGGLLAIAISWHGSLAALDDKTVPAAKPTVGSVEELLLVLEEVHGVNFKICRKPIKGMGLCGRARDDAAKVRDTLHTFLGDRVDVSNWDEGKKKSRPQFTLGRRDVVVTLHTRKPSLSVAFSPVLPDCGDDPRGYRVDEFKGNPAFEAPELIGELEHPVLPGRALTERMGGGVAVLGTIDANGRVLDLCLLDVRPRGYGFEVSAFDTLRQQRYRPATLSGEPIGTSFASVTEWSMFAPARPARDAQARQE